MQGFSTLPDGANLVSELRLNECLYDALVKVSRQGSDDAWKVANQWKSTLHRKSDP